MGHWSAGPCRGTSEGGQPRFLTIACMPVTSSHLRGREEAGWERLGREATDLDRLGWRQRLHSLRGQPAPALEHSIHLPPTLRNLMGCRAGTRAQEVS